MSGPGVTRWDPYWVGKACVEASSPSPVLLSQGERAVMACSAQSPFQLLPVSLQGKKLGRETMESTLFLSMSALRSMEDYISPSVSSLVTETILVLRTSSPSGLQALRYRLRRVWERRPRVPRAGWLCCCSCA